MSAQPRGPTLALTNKASLHASTYFYKWISIFHGNRRLASLKRISFKKASKVKNFGNAVMSGFHCRRLNAIKKNEWIKKISVYKVPRYM